MDTKYLGLIGFFLFISLFGIVFFQPLFEYKVDVQESEQINGIVTGTDIEVQETDDDKKYIPKVSYRYSVGGESYTDNNVFPPTTDDHSYGSRSGARSVTNGYESGSQVTVNYRPTKPDQSYLEENVGVNSAPMAISVVYIVLAVLFGGWMIYIGFNRWKQKKWIRDTPTQDIESLAIGPSEVKGVMKAKDDPLIAPFTDEECVYYEYTVKEYKRSGDDKSWQTIDEGSSHTPFYVDDGTGKLLVEPHDETYYEIKEEDETTLRSSSSSPPSGSVSSFIENNSGVSTTSNKRKYIQKIIRNEDEGYIFGTAQTRDIQDDDEYRDNAQRLHIKKVEDGAMAEPLFMVSGVDESEVIDRRQFSLWRAPFGSVFLVIALFMLIIVMSYFIDIRVPVWF